MINMLIVSLQTPSDILLQRKLGQRKTRAIDGAEEIKWIGQGKRKGEGRAPRADA
jgi:hypothetical protein